MKSRYAVLKRVPWQDVCKFLSGAFFVNAGILFYLYLYRVSSSTEWCAQASAPRDLLYYSVRPSASFPPVCVDLVVSMVVKAKFSFSQRNDRRKL